MYKITENFLSDKILDIIYNKYFNLSFNDLDSHLIWDKEMTGNNKLPKCYTSNMSTEDALIVQNFLYDSQTSPFYHNKNIRNAKMAVQKLLPGCLIPKHEDKCIASMTVFLNKDNNINEGGDFIWYDKDQHVIKPKHNRAVWTLNSFNLTHEVIKVINYYRVTLQIFIKDNNYA